MAIIKSLIKGTIGPARLMNIILPANNAEQAELLAQLPQQLILQACREDPTLLDSIRKPTKEMCLAALSSIEDKLTKHQVVAWFFKIPLECVDEEMCYTIASTNPMFLQLIPESWLNKPDVKESLKKIILNLPLEIIYHFDCYGKGMLIKLGIMVADFDGHDWSVKYF